MSRIQILRSDKQEVGVALCDSVPQPLRRVPSRSLSSYKDAYFLVTSPMPVVTGMVDGKFPAALLIARPREAIEMDQEERQAIDFSLLLELSHMKTGHWVAVDRLVEQYGEGETCGEAVRDLIVTLYEDRGLLRSEDGHLVERLAHELRLLEATLPEEMPSPL